MNIIQRVTNRGSASNQGTSHVGGLVVGGLLAAVTLSACNIDINLNDIEGSGDAETVTYPFDSFDEVKIGSAFDADISIEEGSPTVEVIIDDNLVEYLEVEVRNGRLEVGMEDNSYDFKNGPKVTITMPSITSLDGSGASYTVLNGLDETSFDVEASGASTVEVRGSTESMTVDASGASNIDIDGAATDIELDGSGASSIDLSDLVADALVVDLSGASSAEIDNLKTVTGDLSGASSLEVDGDSDVSVNTTGASTIDRDG